MKLRSSTRANRFLVHHKLAVFVMAAFAVLSFFASSTSVSSVYEVVQNVGEAESTPLPKHIPTPDKVRAIYMSSWVAGTRSMRDDVLGFVNSSEANSVVIDIKDYTGKIAFAVDSDIISEYGAVERRIPDIRALIDFLHDQNIYVIGRLAVFQDPNAAKKFPELAVGDKRGGIWRDRKGLPFIDPAAKRYWDYIIEIARASEKVGFDEINFDYIRYPSDGKLSLVTYPFTKERDKPSALEDFFKYLQRELAILPIPISADIFGLVLWEEGDLGIGQVLERVAPHFDYIAPMTYPSHYDAGFNGFKNPSEHPYEVLLSSIKRAMERLQAADQDPQKLRPWIQDFDLGADYGIEEILLQKKAIYDAGLDSWMAWDPSNRYTREAYRRPAEAE